MFKPTNTNNVYEYNSKIPGKTITIMGSVHGNEPVGSKAIKYILENPKEFLPTHGKIMLIIGNKASIDANKRFIDEDMNRLALCSDAELIEKNTIESLRFLEIKKHLIKTDFLLDIHATQQPNDKTFTYSENSNDHQKLYKSIDCDVHIEQGIPLDERTEESMSGCDNFVDNAGGVAITLESGFREDLSKVDWTIQQIKNFIQSIVNSPNSIKQNQAKIFTLVKEIMVKSNNFSFIKDYDNFEMIQKHTIFAVDKSNEYQFDQDSFMIFPKTNNEIGKAAGYLAIKNSKKN